MADHGAVGTRQKTRVDGRRLEAARGRAGLQRSPCTTWKQETSGLQAEGSGTISGDWNSGSEKLTTESGAFSADPGSVSAGWVSHNFPQLNIGSASLVTMDIEALWTRGTMLFFDLEAIETSFFLSHTFC